MTIEQNLKEMIRDVPDFPKPGILFKDITPILANPKLCSEIVEAMQQRVKTWEAEAIAAIESRGFLFGMLLAQKMELPFIPIRKKGKLPGHTFQKEYGLEYGTATIEIHRDALKFGQRVLIHDDVLATGGTSIAAAELIKEAGAQVAGFQFVIELGFLNGRKNLQGLSENISTLAGY